MFKELEVLRLKGSNKGVMMINYQIENINEETYILKK